jgi:hypothetical protein
MVQQRREAVPLGEAGKGEVPVLSSQSL